MAPRIIVNLLLPFLLLSQTRQEVYLYLSDFYESEISAVRNFENDYDFIHQLFLGKSLVYYDGAKLKSNYIKRVLKNKPFITIDFKENNPIKIEDIIFTFRLVRDYYKTSKNELFRFFGDVKLITENKGQLILEIQNYDSFAIENLFLPIIKKNETISGLVDLDLYNYYGYSSYVHLSSNPNINLVRKDNISVNSILSIQLVTENNISYMSDLVQNNSVYILNHMSDILSVNDEFKKKYFTRSIEINYNHVFYLSINEKYSQDEINALFYHINRESIVSKELYSASFSVSDDFVGKNSTFHGIIEAKMSDSEKTRNKLDLKLWRINKNGFFLPDKSEEALNLYYIRNSNISGKIAKEIAFNFAEIKIPVNTIAVSLDELKTIRQENQYDFIIQPFYYQDHEIENFIDYLIKQNMYKDPQIMQFYKRFKSRNETHIRAVFLERLLRGISKKNNHVPFLRNTHRIIAHRRNIFNIIQSEKGIFDKRYFINDVNEWKILE